MPKADILDAIKRIATDDAISCVIARSVLLDWLLDNTKQGIKEIAKKLKYSIFLWCRGIAVGVCRGIASIAIFALLFFRFCEEKYFTSVLGENPDIEKKANEIVLALAMTKNNEEILTANKKFKDISPKQQLRWITFNTLRSRFAFLLKRIAK